MRYFYLKVQCEIALNNVFAVILGFDHLDLVFVGVIMVTTHVPEKR